MKSAPLEHTLGIGVFDMGEPVEFGCCALVCY
jgi:hypothetical protein